MRFRALIDSLRSPFGLPLVVCLTSFGSLRSPFGLLSVVCLTSAVFDPLRYGSESVLGFVALAKKAAHRKLAQLRSAPTTRSFSPPKPLVSAMFGMKHRPLDEGGPLRVRRPAFLGGFGVRSHIRCWLWNGCDIL